MALISSPIKSDSIPTNFDARGNKSGDTDYGKYGPDISVYAEAQTNGDTTILNDKGKILATVKKGGSFVVNSGALDATKDKQLILNLEANKSSYVKEAANKVKDTLPSGTSIDDINKHFGATPLSSNTGPLNTTAVAIASVSLSDKTRQSFNKALSYPAKRNSKQDSVIFTIKKYGSIKLDPKTPTNMKRTIGTSVGNIILPIQPSISDSNTVQWGEDRLNPVQMVGAVSALNAALKKGKSAGDIGRDYIYGLGKSMEAFGDDENTRNAIMAYFAGEAVGNQNLLSRLNGSVLNPNLELLFQGPQLRNFNFNFQLTPRSKDDVTQVRKIIRTFKQAMAVQRSQSELFLSAPFVFGIQYVLSDTKNNHPYLPRIHDCALTNFSVDYTPDGSYMTYADGSMTSYRLTMQFQELTPIYNDDYGNEKDDTDKDTNIGY